MLPHQIDPDSGVRMVGGEIPDWSEEAPAPGSTAIADLVGHSAQGLADGARVLLAGATAVALREHLPQHVRVDLLVRGLDDARALARSSLDAGRHVVAGSLDRLPGDEAYDLVVALGGPEATLAPDSAPVGGLAWLRLVAGLVTADGRMVASIGNPAGLDRLLAVDDGQAVNGWAPLGDTVPDPIVLDDVRSEGAWQVLAAYPEVASPTVLLTEADARTSHGPAQLAVRSLASRFTGSPTTSSPWRTADRLVRVGLGLAMAPAWVVLGGDVAAVSGSPGCVLPPGATLLETRLREAVESRSHLRTRQVVGSYAAWLATLPSPVASVDGGQPATGTVAGVAIDPRDVAVDADGRLSPLDPSATPFVSHPVVALRQELTAFAERVCADGTALLWDAPTVEMVVPDLLSMAGVDVSFLPAPGERAGHRPGPSSREAELLRLRGAETALEETRRQVTWLEGTLRAKDRRIRTLERAIAVESSAAYKVVHQLTRPVPALKRRARAFLDDRAKGS